MKCRKFLAFFAVVLCCIPLAYGAGSSPEDLFNAAISTWRSGDLLSAREQLTALIDSKTEDPRVFYYRGILAEQLGENGDADFKVAAKLETKSSASTSVNRSLEKTQGVLRRRIEKFRADARNAIKADPEAARLKEIYREALDARAQGDLFTAISKFEKITETGKDPRYFYMHGVALAESGDTEKAKAAFAEGLKHEATPKDAELVSIALADVQGDIRRMIEEQTVLQVGDQAVTRQSNQRDLQRRESMMEDRSLAEANAAAKAEEKEAADEAEQRRLDAIAEIRAEKQAEAELQAKISEKPMATKEDDETLIAKADPSEMPAEGAEGATAEPAPEVDPSAPANPFLGGGEGAEMPATGVEMAAASSVSPGPVDMSYMPVGLELLIYARPADMLKSGFAKPLMEMEVVQSKMAELSTKFGFVPEDIDSVTMGTSKVMQNIIPLIMQLQAGPQGGGAPPNVNLMSGDDSVGVLRTVKDFDPAALVKAANGTEGTHDGKTYFVIPGPDPMQPPMAFYSLDARTFLFSTETGLKAAMDNGPGEPTLDDFVFVSRSSHFVQAFSSPLLAGMSGSIPSPPNAPPQATQLIEAIKGKISGFAIVMEAGSDVKLDIKLNLTDDAAEASTALSGVLAMAKQFAPLALGSAPPELQPSLQQAVLSLAASNSETVLTASLSIPGSVVQVLKDNPQLLEKLQPPGASGQSTPSLPSEPIAP